MRRVLTFITPGSLQPSIKAVTSKLWNRVTLPLTISVQQAAFWVLSHADRLVRARNLLVCVTESIWSWSFALRIVLPRNMLGIHQV